MKKKLKNLIDWYIRGYYHCDKCRYCWSEYSYEGDGDCGCYIFGEIRDTCRLLPPLRWLIGWPKRKRALYWEEHQYDDCGEWFENSVTQDEAMREAIFMALQDMELCFRDPEGKLLPACKDDVIEFRLWDAKKHYEEKCHPVEHISLKEEWLRLLKKTWKQFKEVFAPYFVRE